ncbi:MAG: alpha/beta hydrolase-fold protein [Bacteroidota bacterium]
MQFLKNFGRQLFFRWHDQFASNRRISWCRMTYRYPSCSLGRKVQVDWYLPPGFFNRSIPRFPVLIMNDGQDLLQMQVPQHLEDLLQQQQIRPWVILGIHAGDRTQEYGTIDRPDYAQRGTRAKAYAQFLEKELYPRILRKLQQELPTDLAIAGFSLGGLSAFDLAWEQVLPFRKVGVFSGSFWWRSKKFKPKDPDADRIVIDKIESTSKLPPLRYWMQTGTEDEKADRNKNGVIDAIDDTLDVIASLKERGVPENKIEYFEVKGGKHEPDTWGKAFPDFMKWLERS